MQKEVFKETTSRITRNHPSSARQKSCIDLACESASYKGVEDEFQKSPECFKYSYDERSDKDFEAECGYQSWNNEENIKCR